MRDPEPVCGEVLYSLPGVPYLRDGRLVTCDLPPHSPDTEHQHLRLRPSGSSEYLWTGDTGAAWHLPAPDLDRTRRWWWWPW